MKPICFALALATAAMIGRPAGSGAAPAPTGQTLAGRYLLSQRRSGTQPPDAFELKPDGSCIVEVAGKSGVAGTWRASRSGVFTMTLASSSSPILSGRHQLRKYALQLFPGEPSELLYVRWPLSPDRPPPPEGELLGIQVGRSELGTLAQRMTADHRYELRERDLVPEDRTYYDMYMKGTFAYADGIITYRPSESNAPVKIDYSKDFVVSRDGKCLWLVLPALDRLLCVTRAKTLDLGPPPEGFRAGAAQ